MALSLALFSLVYLAVFFPHAFFRHDDWMNISEGLRSADTPSLFFSPTIYFGGERGVWFFRPLYKFLNYAFYEVFGTNYYAWLSVQLLFTLAALWISWRLVQEMTAKGSRSVLFVILFCASLQIHSGSLLWAGEGLMNCPQIFLLALTLFCFRRATTGGSWLYWAGSLVCYSVALLIKESGVFLTAFLFAWVFAESPWKQQPMGNKVRLLLPHGLLTAAFLVFRLGVLPVTIGYHPRWEWASFLHSTGKIAATLGLPVVVALGAWTVLGERPFRRFGEVARHFLFYLPFLAVSVAPYLMHEFFSPGWLFQPGFFLIWIFCLLPWPELKRERRAFAAAGGALAVLSGAAVLVQMNRLSWWTWEHPQRQLLQILSDADSSKITKVELADCQGAPPGEIDYERIIGSEEHMRLLWWVIHRRDVGTRYFLCEHDRSPASENVLRLKWTFGNLSRDAL